MKSVLVATSPLNATSSTGVCVTAFIANLYVGFASNPGRSSVIGREVRSPFAEAGNALPSDALAAVRGQRAEG